MAELTDPVVFPLLPVSLLTWAKAILDIRVRRTPIQRLQCGLLLKREDLQLTGSFKVRGVLSVVEFLRPTEVVAGSSGNHGIALAHAARRAGIQATIVMTRESRPGKRRRIERLGAKVVQCDGGLIARDARARELAEERSASYISSFDDVHVIAGQATVGMEIIDDPAAAGVTTVVVPVGGGGLLAGASTVLKSQRPSIRVVGVEPAGADDTRQSLAAGRRIEIPPPTTICDGVRAQIPGRMTFAIYKELVDDVIVVQDQEVVEAMRMLAEQGIKLEPTGALAVAGALSLGKLDGVLAIASGGNISMREHARLVQAS